MSTEAKPKYEVGQRLWWVYSDKRRGESFEVEITKVGRKWLELKKAGTVASSAGRADMETLEVDRSRARLYRDKTEHERQVELSALWRSLREAIGYSPTRTATVEGVHKAAAILGLTLETEAKK